MFKSAIATKVTQWIKQVPLYGELMIRLVLQIVLAVGLTGDLYDGKSQLPVAKRLDSLRHEVSDRLNEQLTQHLSVPHRINRITAEAIGKGQGEQAVPKTLETPLMSLIQRCEEVSPVLVGIAQGLFRSDRTGPEAVG